MRDDEDLGSCLVCLGSIGQLNHFHNQNPEPDARRDDQDNPNISWPNYHSGANGEYQPVMADEPVHELLRTERNPGGRIEWFPGHPHEGVVSAPPEYDFAQVVGWGRSTVSGRTFNLAVALDGETMADAVPVGRAVAAPDLPPLRRHELGHRRRRAVVRDRAAERRDEADLPTPKCSKTTCETSPVGSVHVPSTTRNARGRMATFVLLVVGSPRGGLNRRQVRPVSSCVSGRDGH